MISEDPPVRYAASIWVEGPATSEIERLRRPWDSQQKAVAAHMTVVYPQLASVEEPSLLDGARNALEGAPRFSVSLDHWADLAALEALHPAGTRVLTAAFPDFRNPIVLLPDASGATVLDLRRRLGAVFDQPPELLDHPPFVTIGQGLDDRRAAEASAELATYLPSLAFDVRAVDILRIDASGAAHSLGLVALGIQGQAVRSATWVSTS